MSGRCFRLRIVLLGCDVDARGGVRHWMVCTDWSARVDRTVRGLADPGIGALPGPCACLKSAAAVADRAKGKRGARARQAAHRDRPGRDGGAARSHRDGGRAGFRSGRASAAARPAPNRHRSQGHLDSWGRTLAGAGNPAQPSRRCTAASATLPMAGADPSRSAAPGVGRPGSLAHLATGAAGRWNRRQQAFCQEPRPISRYRARDLRGANPSRIFCSVKVAPRELLRPSDADGAGHGCLP